MSRGKRFESARRLSDFPAKPVKTRSPRCSCRGLCQQYVSSRLYPKASSSVLACYKWLKGIAGGVGESSGIERLTDVPGFWRLRHTGRGCYAPALLLALIHPSAWKVNSANISKTEFSEVTRRLYSRTMVTGQ
jgi:hypothetical protein